MRYYCHHCHTQIPAGELLPEFTCPSCNSGFVEEMPGGGGGGGGGTLSTPGRGTIHGSNLDSSAEESQMAGSEGGLSSLVATRMSSDDFSDDNSDVEFLDAVNGPLAQVLGLFQQSPSTGTTTTTSAQLPSHQQQQSTSQRSTTPVTTTSSDSALGQSSSSESSSANQPPQANRIVTRSTARLTRNPGQAHPAYSAANQTLADVLNDFITGVSFGTQYPEGTSGSHSHNQGSSSSGNQPIPANRGLINIDFPLPFFLHSNPGDYAWGNAGFDAVITQLLNNLDGSNSGPPPMPKEQVENLPTVKISDEQVKSTNLQCTVCMDDFQVGDSARQLPCEHFFHQACIIPWLELHASCPICRKTFVTGTNANLTTSDPQSQSNPVNPNVTNPTSDQATTNQNNPNSNTPPTNRNATSSSSSTTTTTNQNVAPRYDYTEDDCD